MKRSTSGRYRLSTNTTSGWFFTNDTFARRRHEVFVSQILAALEDELADHPDDDNSAWIRWLSRSSR